MNLKRRLSNAERMRQQSDFVLAWLRKLAAGFRVELLEETQAIYLEMFCNCQTAKLETAFHRTLAEWPEASKMPPPAFIRERYEAAPCPPEVIAAAEQRLIEQYRNRPEPKLLKSVLDESPAVSPPRHLRDLTPEELEQRMRTLLAQAQQLGVLE